jgi:hypothetical protein
MVFQRSFRTFFAHLLLLFMQTNPFTPGFQRRLLAMLLQYPETYSLYNDVWDPTYFDDPIHRKIVHAYMHIMQVGNEPPTKLSIGQELAKDYDLTKEIPSDVTALMEEVALLYTYPVENINYSIDEVRKWAQHHALIQAVENSIGFIQSGETEKLMELFQRAQNVGDDVRLAGADFYRTDPQLPDEIIPGLIYRKSIGVIYAESKSFKTWNLIAMCIAVGMGKSWLGFPACKPVRTLYCNWELEEELFKVRVDKVAAAMGVARADLEGHVDFLNLKGKPNQIDRMLARIRAFRPTNDPWGLAAIDPIYKLYGSGDGKENAENSANVIGAMFEKLEQFAHELETSIFLAHHFKKGPKGAIRDIDLGSGSGVFARAPDCLLFLKELETEEPTWSCIPILRYFPRIEPFGLRLGTGDQWPLLIRDDSVDVTKESGKAGAPTKYTVENVVAILPTTGLRSKDWLDQTMQDLHCSDKVFRERKKEAIELGFVRPDGDPSKQATLFVPTEKGEETVRLSGLRSTIAESAMRQNGNGKRFAKR